MKMERWAWHLMDLRRNNMFEENDEIRTALCGEVSVERRGR
jgi:hypothetical protein